MIKRLIAAIVFAALLPCLAAGAKGGSADMSVPGAGEPTAWWAHG